MGQDISGWHYVPLTPLSHTPTKTEEPDTEMVDVCFSVRLRSEFLLKSFSYHKVEIIPFDTRFQNEKRR